MDTLVGWIIIAVAALTVAGTILMVANEKIEHEEHFIPPASPDEEAAHAARQNGGRDIAATEIS
ncbi:MAG: hypothetical protein IPK19_42045 [Chloroflexi bacterium]|nr:hypothetical protein [Chloroflexota bacterium]